MNNQHKTWFDEGYSNLLCQRKQAKLQWLQHPSPINGNNLNKVKCGALKTFQEKWREYLKDKINFLLTHNKNRKIIDSYTGINEFKNGYQHATYLVKDLLVESYNDLNRRDD
jgi:hypothetical protein